MPIPLALLIDAILLILMFSVVYTLAPRVTDYTEKLAERWGDVGDRSPGRRLLARWLSDVVFAAFLVSALVVEGGMLWAMVLIFDTALNHGAK